MVHLIGKGNAILVKKGPTVSQIRAIGDMIFICH